MKVSIATYPWAFDVPGGGERQMQYYRAAIERKADHWPQLELSNFDMWNPEFKDMDVMHYFSCMPSSRDFLDYVKTRKGVPLIISPNFWPEPEGWAESGVLESIKNILWLSNKIIVNSLIEEEALVRLCGIDSSFISVVPNAVDDCFFAPVSPSLFRDTFAIDGPFALNVGNVEPRKNQLAFLKALKNFPELKLVTIGGVRESWYLDTCKEEGKEQFILIDPLPPNSELIRSGMSACEFFAMPSTRETPSIASLEAGAAGAKVLTTELGSTAEYFQDLATYVNPYDIDQMGEAIRSILRKPQDRVLSDRIRELYRWDVVVESLVSCYADVVGKDPRVLN